MSSEGLTRGGIKANTEEHIKLAQLHGDLDAIGIIQGRLGLGMYYPRTFMSSRVITITFEGKKHLWNMLSRLTSRVDEVIISNRDLRRELIHLAAKGRQCR